MNDFPYVWSWRWRTWEFPGATARVPWFGDGVDRAGMRCRVVVRGGMNSALIRFEDGSEFVTSRGGIRRASPLPRTSRRLTTESTASRRSTHAVD